MSYAPTRRDIRAAAEYRPWEDGVAVYIHGSDMHGTRFVAHPISYHVLPGSSPAEPTPTMSLPRAAAQELMDQLWRCGLRPSEGTGSAGSLAATERHLADMRRITGEVLGIDLEAKAP